MDVHAAGWKTGMLESILIDAGQPTVSASIERTQYEDAGVKKDEQNEQIHRNWFSPRSARGVMAVDRQPFFVLVGFGGGVAAERITEHGGAGADGDGERSGVSAGGEGAYLGWGAAYCW